MELRTILYGYSKERRGFTVVPEEAAVVRKIFAEYISGVTLKQIADELTSNHVVYYQDKTSWTKNAVCRILENPHYAGDLEYPAILPKSEYDTAAAIKNSKGGAREQDTEEIAWLKHKMRCGECGSRYTRRKHYSGTHERWVCTNGCKSELFVDDAVLYQKLFNILRRVIGNPSVLRYDEPCETNYEPTLVVQRNEREIDRMIEQPNPAFVPIKKMIYACAAQKFDCCRIDYSRGITEALIAYLEQLSGMESPDFALLKKIVESIEVKKDGSIAIRFLNQKAIDEKEKV